MGCRIDERPGLLLVEAKANWAELSIAGKQLKPNASRKSWENHKRIGAAIGEACDAWQQIHPRVMIARDSHYQLANRLAWTLVTLGIPVVLLYLGFTGDEGIRDVGEPFQTTPAGSARSPSTQIRPYQWSSLVIDLGLTNHLLGSYPEAGLSYRFRRHPVRSDSAKCS